MNPALEMPLVEVWVLACAFLVFFMQAGFMLMESGLSRSKNSFDAALKNLFDFCVAASLFWCFGFGLMYGETWSGVIGRTMIPFAKPEHDGQWMEVFFLFQMMYCATSITIASGAVAERMRFLPYIVMTALVSGLIYPLFGHWVWSGLEAAPGREPAAMFRWLGARGFMDFAGSTVVHSLGGWVALAAVLCVGPRLENQGEERVKIEGHNLPMATLGLFILWLGWLGFTGGRTFGPNPSVPLILINTILAGAAGGVSGLALPLVRQMLRRLRGVETQPRQTAQASQRPEFVFSIESTISGALAGLVAISAGCNVVAYRDAIAIGLIAGAVARMFAVLLQRLRWRTPSGRWMRIDDPVAAISAHGFAGVWGTLAVAWFAPAETLEAGSRGAQLAIQCQGAAVCFLWAFGVATAVLWGLTFSANYLGLSYLQLRPSAAQERQGMNMSEHGASTEMFQLLQTLERLTGTNIQKGRGKEHPTEADTIANLFDRLLHAKSELETAASEARRREQEQAAAERANRMKSEFLALMSHELRTPMIAINAFTEMLLEREEKNANREDLARIADNGKRLLDLIDDILDLSKIELGKFVPRYAVFPLASFLEEIQALMELRAQDFNVFFRVQMIEPLPAAIRTDPARLRQVLINLLANAIRFSEGRTVRLAVARNVVDGQAMIQFEVIDTGDGMDEETLRTIFQPFTTGKNRPDLGGTGLGLAISRGLVELLGGGIRARSELGEGSTFTVSLPYQTLAADELPPPRETPARESVVSPAIQLDASILVAEDNPDNQRITKHRLSGAGVSVAVANDGEEALEAALAAWGEGAPFDVILMDIRMPNMDGYEATRRLRAAGYPGVIVALTANAMKGDQRGGKLGVREECLAAGCDEVLDRSLSRTRLLREIQTALELAKTRDFTDGGFHSSLAIDPWDAELVPSFVAQLETYLRDIRRFLASEQWNDLAHRLHQFKGACDMHGFYQPPPACRNAMALIEEQAPPETIREAVSQVLQAAERIRAGVSPTYREFCREPSE